MLIRSLFNKAKLIPLLLVSMAGGVFAQGDSCSNPLVIAAGSYFNMGTSPFDDYYQVTVPAGHLLRFAETRDTGDHVFETWNLGCTNRLAFSVTAGLNVMTWSNTTSSAVAVIIRGQNWNGSPNAYDFDISFHFFQCPDDTFEDNDDCASVATISAGSHTGLSIASGDRDFYTISVPVGMRLTLLEALDVSSNVDWNLSGTGCIMGPGSADTSFHWTNDTGVPLDVSFNAKFSYHGDALCAPYAFDISFAPDQCLTAPDDRMEENDDCVTANAVADGIYADLSVSAQDKDHYAFNVRNGATVSIDVLPGIHGSGVDGFLRFASSPSCGTGFNGSLNLLASLLTNQDPANLSWTNITGADMNLILEVSARSLEGSSCNTYDLVITGSGDPGANVIGPVFCSPMDVNSTGASTRLSGFWGTGVGSDLHLEVTSGPPAQFGYFLVGTATTEPGLTISQGRLCLGFTGGHSFGRYNVSGSSRNSVGQFDGSGTLQNVVSTSTSGSGFDVPVTVPTPGSPQIMSGSTWHFQLWHREAAGASNFSNGLSVTF